MEILFGISLFIAFILWSACKLSGQVNGRPEDDVNSTTQGQEQTT